MKNEENVKETRIDSDTEVSQNVNTDGETTEEKADSEADSAAESAELSPTSPDEGAADTEAEPTLFDEYEAEYPEVAANANENGADGIEADGAMTDTEANTDSSDSVIADAEADTDSSDGATADESEGESDSLPTDGDETDSKSSHDADESDGSENTDIDESGATDDELEDDPELLAFESKKDIKEEKPRKIDAIFDFVELFVFTLAAVFIITSFFFKYSIVDGDSMNNTLHHNDKLLLWCFMYEPEGGDVVVLEDLSTALKKPIVKRIIAVGGQTVRFTRDEIYVDGVLLDEPYVYTDDYVSMSPFDPDYHNSLFPADILAPIITDVKLGEYYEVTVPEGELFVMGDHRNNSSDSRVIGTVHEDSVLGKVVFRFAPSFEKID